MYNFCTLFDSNYLSRGLAMYESLRQHCTDFHLFIVPFDEKAHAVLDKMRLSHVTLVRREEFEDPALLAVRSGRTLAEYYWTATSSVILFVLDRFHVQHCTYIDADLFFYSSPAALIDEMKTQSILITEHRYSPDHRYLAPLTGIYCVQFVTFRNDERGLHALRWWRNACLEWCFARAEDGKFGDQKYLDDWTRRFEGVHVLRHLGGGVAPWNIQQYDISSANGHIIGTERATSTVFSFVFYHFHYLRIYQEGKIDFGDYHLSRVVKELLYRPYLAALEKAKESIAAIDDSFDPHGPKTLQTGWKLPLINLKRKYYRRYNVYPKKNWIPQY